MEKILNVIHNTIYQFFDACNDDEEVPMTDRDKLLLEVNKAICNNLKALEQEPCEDAVSRKDVHDMLENLPVTVEDHWFNWLQKACIRLADLPSVTPKTRWIPCTERLPESDEECCTFLVTDRKGKVTLSEFYLSIKDKKPYWSGMIDVIAWMPLPKGYKAENEKEG